jgi:uncharacterized protein (DUF58 family)
MHLMALDRAVGIMAYGRGRCVLQADRGESQLNRILEALAMIEAVGNLGLDEVIKIEGQRIPRGATVIMITADTTPRVTTSLRHLKRTGRAPILILLDALSFGGAPGSPAIATAARNLGVPVKLVRCGDSLGAALSSPTRAYATVA